MTKKPRKHYFTQINEYRDPLIRSYNDGKRIKDSKCVGFKFLNDEDDKKEEKK